MERQCLALWNTFQDPHLTPESNLTFIDMASNPHSDEILIGLLQVTNDLKIVRWDGTAFVDLGEIDTDTASDRFGGAEIVYEQQSGEAMILWGHANVHQIYYALWNGTTLSPVGQLPDFGGIPKIVRAAADPASDSIFVAAVDDQDDLNVAVWNGDAWIDSRELETSCATSGELTFDIAWEYSGDEAVVAWAHDGENNAYYFKWRKGTSLADHPVEIGPNLQAKPVLIRLHPISGGQKILLLANTNNNNLRYSIWSGNTFQGNPAVLLESKFGTGFLPLDIDEFGVTYTGGAG